MCINGPLYQAIRVAIPLNTPKLRGSNMMSWTNGYLFTRFRTRGVKSRSMDFSTVLDFSKPLDVTVFDQLVSTFYNSSGSKQAEAGDVLKQYQQHQKAWETVDRIIEQSKNINSKYIALQVLERFIQNKWSALPKEHSEGLTFYLMP